MKRKLSSLILALLLIVTLISCDAAVSVMGAMGNNILGVDKSTLDSAVNSVTVSEESKTETVDVTDEEKKVNDSTTLSSGKKLTYKTSDGEKTLFTVGTTTDNKQVLVIGDVAIPLSSDVKIEDIVSILPPQDLTEVANALGSSGKSKEEMIKALDNVISDETTKEATKGTATLLKGLLGNLSSSESSSTRALTRDGESDSSDTGEKINVAFNTILNNLTDSLSNPDKLTMGDVVVLQSITNLLDVAAEDVATLLGLKKNGSSDSSDSMETVNKLLKENETAIKQTLTILNSAANSSSIFKGAGLSEIIDSFMNTGNK